MSDHLSARLTTDTNGNVLGQQGHYPYGESWYAASAATKWQFTSYERDSESGNDYAMFRSYVNRLGRFSSPDPIAGSLSDPQSLNRFAYARSDAVRMVDPLGLAPRGAVCLLDDNGDCTGIWASAGGAGGGYLEQEEVAYFNFVSFEFLKKQLRNLFETNAECAHLFGEGDKALGILNKARFTDVSAPGWQPRTTGDRSPPAQAVIRRKDSQGHPVAAGVYFSTRSKDDKVWNGGPFTIYINIAFWALPQGDQLTLLVHEMLHVGLSGTEQGGTALDSPNSPYSYQNIARICGTSWQ